MPTDTFEHTLEPAASNYATSLPLEQQLRAAAMSPDLTVGSSGTFVDNGTDRWHYMVTAGTPGVLTIQLQVSDQITWWKQMVVSANAFGSWFQIRTLGTKDNNRVATVDLMAADAQSGTLKLDFWRGGFLGLGAYITTRSCWTCPPTLVTRSRTSATGPPTAEDSMPAAHALMFEVGRGRRQGAAQSHFPCSLAVCGC